MGRNCIKCGEAIPEGRLKILPNTQTCVKHSSAEKKVGMPVTYGQGDHTYVELAVIEAEDYNRIERQSRTTRGTDFGFGL